MKKFLTVILMLIIAAAVYFGYAHFSGGAIPTGGLMLGGEKAQVRNVVMRFFENIRFKNLKALPELVDSEARHDDIESFLYETFRSKLSDVDVQSVTIKNIELDSTKERARTRVQLIGYNLSTQMPFDISKIIFLYREGSKKWLIDIKNLATIKENF